LNPVLDGRRSTGIESIITADHNVIFQVIRQTDRGEEHRHDQRQG
jgi:hypothetical protein